MLEVEGLSVQYGKHRAVDDAALSVAANEIVVILGANGAGKSTLLKAVAGLQPPGAGARVALGDRELVGLPPHQIVEAGLALVPEGRGIFGELTVRENLLLGAFARRARADEAHNRERVLALFPRLAERLDQTARTMSGGEQQMVAIGRALMSAPQMLLARRALARPLAVAERRAVPRAWPHPRRRHRRAAGRAECAQELRHRRPRLSDREWPHRRRRPRGRACRPTRRCSAPISAAQG